ncbi:MAG: hypothetical protein IKR68_03595 [Lachnospiraceae bacterium]|nr:hypothetical protein [Lachnospiraceae bacterium]
MLTAIVVGIVMTAFALSLLLITYTLYAQTAKRTGVLQCRYLAEEVADELAAELKDTDSEIYKVLDSHVYKDRPGEGISGTWVPEGATSIVGADSKLVYTLEGRSDHKLDTFDTTVVFTYVAGMGGEAESEVAGGEYDREDVPPDEFSGTDLEDDWDKMASGGPALGGGDCVVTIEVTCKKGDSTCTVTKDTTASF